MALILDFNKKTWLGRYLIDVLRQKAVGTLGCLYCQQDM
jgi:hypothetical protein